MEEKELFKLIGLGAPYGLAAATYGVFTWLDNNASDEATQVIASWLHGRSHNKPDLGNLIINTFDRIYTSPLFSFRAFRRSAAISSIIWLLVILIPSMSGVRSGLEKLGPSSVAIVLVVYLIVVVLSDYISLPFVRYSLNLAKTKPISATVISSVVGLIVVTIGFFILFFIGVTTINWLSPIYPKVKQFNMQFIAVLVATFLHDLFQGS